MLFICFPLVLGWEPTYLDRSVENITTSILFNFSGTILPGKEKVCTIALFFLLLLVQGCSLYVAEVAEQPDRGTGSYTLDEEGKYLSTENTWWLSLDDPYLDELMEKVLSDNLTLQQGIARLLQVISSEKQIKSAQLPPVDLDYEYSTKKESGLDRRDSWQFDLNVSWELDLWGKLSNRSKAAALQTQATEEDLEGLALLISFQLGHNYYALIEQRLQKALLERQIKINSIYLNLVELRFANGAASLVDVYQQRQLLMAKKAKMVVVDEQIGFLQNRLHVLAGVMPGSTIVPTSAVLPKLPQLPGLGVPADLLHNRPDLRSLYAKLQASYHLVAAAVAERLPQIRIGGSMGLADGDFFYSLFGDAFAALIDWDKRKSEVERQKAIAWEKASFYGEAYLQAVEEVENSLWREHHHLLLLQILEQQLEIARGTLRESRNRYMQGVTDYLPVLAALQTMQELELGYLQRQRELIENRMVLYRALGGSVITPEEAVSTYLLNKDSDRLP